MLKDHKDKSEGCSKCLYQTKIKLGGLNKLASGGRETLLCTIMPIMAWDCARTAFHQSNEFCILLGNSEGKGSGDLPVNSSDLNPPEMMEEGSSSCKEIYRHPRIEAVLYGRMGENSSKPMSWTNQQFL